MLLKEVKLFSEEELETLAEYGYVEVEQYLSISLSENGKECLSDLLSKSFEEIKDLEDKCLNKSETNEDFYKSFDAPPSGLLEAENDKLEKEQICKENKSNRRRRSSLRRRRRRRIYLIRKRLNKKRR